VALRCCAALHYYVRCAPESELAKVYPRTLWPGGEERIIGQCDSHGSWVEWTQSAGARQLRNR
jgi:hypothetical protein